MTHNDNPTSTSISVKNLNLLNTLPTNVFNRLSRPPPLGNHLPQPSFSVSLQSLSLKLLNLGRVELIFRRDLWKKPSFLLWKLG